jgi:transcriptional regulator with XRE-family HTH domain
MWRSRLRTLVHRKEERDRRNYTQADIARATDLRQPTISAWMSYTKRFTQVDAAVAAKLAKWLECDPVELIEYVEDPQFAGMMPN